MALDISTASTLYLSYDGTRIRGRGPLCSDVPSPVADDLYYNTAVDQWCFYDGARWLGPEQVLVLKARSAGGAPTDIAIRTDYAPYITRVAMTTNVATTNNASNYYTVAIQSVNLAQTNADGIYIFTTAADAAGAETAHEGAAGAQPNTNHTFLRYTHLISAGAPGAITSSATVYYRLIVP